MPRSDALSVACSILAFLCFHTAAPVLAQPDPQPVLVVTTNYGAPIIVQGTAALPATIEVPEGAEIQFCWSAAPGVSAPLIAQRWGWDVVDPNDPDDPGWVVPEQPFDGQENCSLVRRFFHGSHNFVAEVSDESQGRSRAVIWIQIVPDVGTRLRNWGRLKDEHREE